MSSRLPPHDRDAEAATIGSMMLSRAARRDAPRLVAAADFYLPALGEAFAAIVDLDTADRPVDPLTVFTELQRRHGVLTRKQLVAIQAETPASANVVEYATRVAQLAAARRLIAIVGAVSDAAWAGDADAAIELLYDVEDVLSAPMVETPALRLAELMGRTQPPYNWCVEGMLEFGDRLIVTGGEGGGKSTLCRQIAVAAAAGAHPFSAVPIGRRRVLFIDLQDDEWQSRREFTRIFEWAKARSTWDDNLFALVCRPQKIDVTSTDGYRWLRSYCARYQPELVVVAPLLRSFAGNARRGKNTEETADLVTDAFDRLIAEFGFALVLEGHSPHGDKGDRDGYRVRGSAVFQSWPNFVFGLKRFKAADGDRAGAEFVPSRGSRDRARRWPSVLYEGLEHQLPWVAPDERF